MPKFPYQFFEHFITRSPLLPFSDFKKIFSPSHIDEEKLLEICSDPLFKEAIYLASPYLYKEIDKHLSKNELPAKLKNTILKYYSRINTRCTPFGLFSGIGLGGFISTDHHKQTIGYDEQRNSKYIRDTRFDMHFLMSLAQKISKLPEIKSELLYYPNNSIYQVGRNIRYIEYDSNDGKRDYFISAAPLSDELNKILIISKNGKSLNQLKNILVNENVSTEDALSFLEELIDNQVLVNELEPNIVGIDFLDSIISVLDKIGAQQQKNILSSLKSGLNDLDKLFGNPIKLYTDIETLIKSINVDFDQKFLFQTDLYFDHQLRLPCTWKKDLKKGISFLNKITPHQDGTEIEKFKQAFRDRFENEEVLLSFALDTELGIGYRQDFQNKGVHPYLADLHLPAEKNKTGLRINLNPFQIILNQKVQEALLENKNMICLTDGDFKDFEENWNDLPETISVMTEIVSEGSEEKLFIQSGSSNAGTLLARFSSEKSLIRNLVKEIAAKEDTLKPDKIHAEIIHLPESRTGNILRRPQSRNYEIPYLAKSHLPCDCQLQMDDLYVSIKNERIILHSKKHNKEVVPYLTNAHNYASNSLPVYHFLCDLNTQNVRSGLSFNWGGLAHIYNFLPRVEYENIILSKARWRLHEAEINQFVFLLHKNDFLFKKEVEIWRINRGIPKWVQWVQSDNILVINLENDELLRMFFSALKNYKSAYIEEFLFNANDDYTKQFIFPIYKMNTA